MTQKDVQDCMQSDGYGVVTCGVQCRASKWRNSNKYYGTIINSHSGADAVSLWG